MQEQVLTASGHEAGSIGLADQGPVSIQAAIAQAIRHLYVRQEKPADDRKGTPPPLKAGGVNPAQASQRGGRSRKPQRGGWPATRYIDRTLYWATREQAGLLALAGYPFTIFATARAPLGMTDSGAKRHIARSFARLGQALERRGHAYVGLTVYEKPMGGFLHGHLLLSVGRKGLHVVKRWADRFDERRPTKPYETESVALHARPAVKSESGLHPEAAPVRRPLRTWALPSEE